MSRNLGDTSCEICYSSIVLEETARPATEPDCGVYFKNYPPGFMVANAHCYECGAKYLAWVDLPGRGGHWKRSPGDLRPFVDLSFRSSFNDEPGPDDLPTPERLLELARSDRANQIARAKSDIAELQGNLEQLESALVISRWEVYRR